MEEEDFVRRSEFISHQKENERHKEETCKRLGKLETENATQNIILRQIEHNTSKIQSWIEKLMWLLIAGIVGAILTVILK